MSPYIMKNKAFTLIELLVVITIIGILSGIVIVSVQDGIDRARMAGSQRFSHSIRTRLALDMVGRWPFEFNAVDFSGWNNHGALVTGTAPCVGGPWVAGVTGQALCFDGSDDRVDMGRRTSLAPASITMEAWVNISALGTYNGIVTNKVDANRGINLQVGTVQNIAALVGNGVGHRYIKTTWPPVLNSWYHIVITHDDASDNNILYVNGRQETISVFALVYDRADPITRIGMFYTFADISLPFNGIIDEVRIFRAAVPASYIQKRYVQGVKSLAANSGITQEEKQQRIAELRNSGQLVIDLDAALAGPIDFSSYTKYFESLSLDASE